MKLGQNPGVVVANHTNQTQESSLLTCTDLTQELSLLTIPTPTQESSLLTLLTPTQESSLLTIPPPTQVSNTTTTSRRTLDLNTIKPFLITQESDFILTHIQESSSTLPPLLDTETLWKTQDSNYTWRTMPEASILCHSELTIYL